MSSISHAIWGMYNVYGPNSNNFDRDCYEFGIYCGETMREFMGYAKHHNIKFNRMWGFDSFEGLPEEDRNINGWVIGQFSSKDIFHTPDISSTMEKVYSNIISEGKFMEVKLVPGYFKDSLKDELVKEMKPAAFIHIDSDLYSSAYEALDFMARNKLVVKDTVILYDDWVYEGKVYEEGEAKAHKEISEKYNLKWEPYISESLREYNMSFILR